MENGAQDLENIQQLVYKDVHCKTDSLICDFFFPISKVSIDLTGKNKKEKKYKTNRADAIYAKTFLYIPFSELIGNLLKFCHQGQNELFFKTSANSCWIPNGRIFFQFQRHEFVNTREKASKVSNDVMPLLKNG